MTFVIIYGSLLPNLAVIWNERNWVCECGSQYMMYFGLRISWTQKDDQFVGFENQLEAKRRSVCWILPECRAGTLCTSGR
jgi:hypothetical protein